MIRSAVRRAVPVAALALLGTVYPAPGPAADIETVVERTLASHGGRDALAACEGFRARGRVLEVTGGLHARTRLAVALDGRFRRSTSWPERTEIGILSGPLAWTGEPGSQRPADPTAAVALRIEYDRWAAIFDLARTPVEALVPDDVSAEGWLRVRHDGAGGPATILEIDPESETIRRVRSEIRRGDDVLESVAELSDWRDVDGLVLPFRVAVRVDGIVTTEILLERIDLDVELAPGTFAPDAAAADL